MKIFCNYPEPPSGNLSKKKDACGTCIMMGDESTTEDLKDLMAHHVAENHGSVEETHRNVLMMARAAFTRLRDGQFISGKEAQGMLDQVNTLLNMPKTTTEVPAPTAPPVTAPAATVPHAPIPATDHAPAAKE
jgi:hypothetical protein